MGIAVFLWNKAGLEMESSRNDQECVEIDSVEQLQLSAIQLLQLLTYVGDVLLGYKPKCHVFILLVRHAIHVPSQ